MSMRDALQLLFVACCALALPACQLDDIEDLLGADGGVAGSIDDRSPAEDGAGGEGEESEDGEGEGGADEEGEESEDGEGEESEGEEGGCDEEECDDEDFEGEEGEEGEEECDEEECDADFEGDEEGFEGEGEEEEEDFEGEEIEDGEGEEEEEDFEGEGEEDDGFEEQEAACRPSRPSGAGAILTIGDSIFDYNVCSGSIAETLARTLDREVIDVSIGGATFLDAGEGIPGQYFAADWSWLVFDGGGNDLLDTGCVGDRARRVLDRLIAADGRSGAMVDFARTRAAEGMRVMMMGYYVVRPGGAPAACIEMIGELAARQQQAAERSEGVYFFDSRNVIDAGDAGNYDPDGLHPSPQGSAHIGQGIAEAIRAIERR